MKGLLIILIVLAGVWLWRSRSISDDHSAPSKPQALPEPLDMVRCARCGMHIPGNEAIVGEKGVYCSVDHLHQSEV